MKPTRNRIFCSACHRPKMLFESQEKADNFIRYNAAEMAEDENDEYIPIRSYYCPSCGGWHVTHQVVTWKQTHINNIQETAYKLERFVEQLKKSYSNKDWRKWEPQMEVANEWVMAIEHLSTYNNFLMEVRRQLKHYQSMITCAAIKEEKAARREKKKLAMNLNHYDTTKLHLVDCINALMDGNRPSALVSLTAADNCLKTIPVSREKIELMTLFMQVVQNSHLFERQTDEQQLSVTA